MLQIFLQLRFMAGQLLRRQQCRVTMTTAQIIQAILLQKRRERMTQTHTARAFIDQALLSILLRHKAMVLSPPPRKLITLGREQGKSAFQTKENHDH